MRSIIRKYYRVPRPLFLLTVAELLLYLINAAFILILNIYLRKSGFDDQQIAGFTSYRFLGVLLFAFPFGVFIKGKPLKPFFLAASLIIPLVSLEIVYAISIRDTLLLKSGFLSWGIGLMLLQVCAVPFIMRIATDDVLSEALALNFSTWSTAMILSGVFISGMTGLNKLSLFGHLILFDEGTILRIISVISLAAFGCFLFLKEGKPRAHSARFTTNFSTLVQDYDWDRIRKAIVPTLIISVGAGLTIPFINLFFYSVFGVDSDQFSVYGSISAFLVLTGAFFVPTIRRKLGYMQAILGTQFLAILFLVILGLTEIFQNVEGILTLAVLCFLLRQPLMNMANPMTSELTMKYVGPKNQELISALTSSIWSASWFISAKIFQALRGM
ncbi:MAG: MFS transporter, partial [Fidelibacterota bacterium]